MQNLKSQKIKLYDPIYDLKGISKFLAIAFSLLACSVSCSDESPVNDDEAKPSDSSLIAIRDGFDKRVAEMFDEQKGRPYNIGKSNPNKKWKVHGWNDPQHYAYPRIKYATANLREGRHIDSVNMALIEYVQYFIDDPEKVLHRDHFHWHSEMALRLIEMYGQQGTKATNLITPETEDKILEAVWLYAKRKQEDQVGANTKAEADHAISNTWYIYESENHHAQSFTTLWHFAKLIRGRPGFKNREYDDGRTASEHYTDWKEYINLFFTERAKKGIYIEMMSRDYNHKSVKGMFNIYDFALDEELRSKAGLYLDLYFAYWGEEQLNGISGGGKSRIYQDIDPGTSEYGYLFFGVGEKPDFQSVLLSAMTTAYRPPLVVVDMVTDIKGRGTYEVRQRAMGLATDGFYENPVYHMNTEFGGIVRYSYCTPNFVMGTSMFEARPKSDWTLISSQNRSQGVRFASDEASILPQCEKTGSRAYNTFWSVQEKGTLITQKLKYNTGAGAMRVWFSVKGLSEPSEESNWIFTESDGAYAAVNVVDGCYTWEDETDWATGKWLVCENEYSPLILEVDQKSNYRSSEDFKEKVHGKTIDFSDTILTYEGLYGDTFKFYADYSSAPQVNGETLDYAPQKVYDSPFLKADWNSGVVQVQKGSRSLVLDFNEE